MDFVFDPPILLPHPGPYGFFLQLEYCDPGEGRFLISDQDPYPNQNYWETGRAVTHCFLAGLEKQEPTSDLIYQAEFCHDTTTPTVRKSWGQLKMLYR